MARYIDADALIKELERYDDYAINIVNDQPTADVRENVHGEWEYKDVGGWHCSRCGSQAPFWCFATTQNLANFCPNCGADMRERREDENLESNG